ncbi:MAG: hypothetical protein IMZ44_11890 [Planctomycetes bacterium]|nr:hypothetical protein [Planctomycetota bacterium]
MASDKEVETMMIELANTINWQTAARTFGNFHYTLIGLVVDAWVRVAPDRHWVLEAPPALRKEGRHSRYSDAILVRDSCPAGIVEVEGVNPLAACEKMGGYLKEGPSLFGLCLFYAYHPRGQKGHKQFLFVPPNSQDQAVTSIVEKAKDIGRATSGPLVLVFIDKMYQIPESCKGRSKTAAGGGAE